MYQATAGVKYSSEYARVLALPRRPEVIDTDPEAIEVAGQVSEIMTRPGATRAYNLFPIQAFALIEIAIYGSIFGPLAMGRGKTLVSMLAAMAHKLVAAGLIPDRDAHQDIIAGKPYKDPLLVVPAKLVEKTRRAQLDAYYAGFDVPNFIRVESAEILSRTTAEEIYTNGEFDLVIVDEAHFFKNRKSARAKRLDAFLKSRRTQGLRCSYIDLSGSMLNSSIKEFAHRMIWALGELRAPVPDTWHTVDQWAEALDEKPKQLVPEVGAGVLLQFAQPGDYPDLDKVRSSIRYGLENLQPEDLEAIQLRTAARLGYARHMRETPGIIQSQGESQVGTSIMISVDRFTPDAAVQEAIHDVRKHDRMPDGYTFSSAAEAWNYERQLARGFYYLRDPRPPRSWIEARRQYTSVIRYLVNNNQRGLHSPEHVAQAIAAGHYVDQKIKITRPNAKYLRWLEEGSQGEQPLERILKELHVGTTIEQWKEVEHKHPYETYPQWISTMAIEHIGRWVKAQEGPCMIWVAHRAVAEALVEEYGWAYYGAKGIDRETGGYIGDDDGTRTIILSLKANNEGRDLQYMPCGANMYFATPTPGGQENEQAIARVHRYGCIHDVIRVTYMVACDQDQLAIEQMLRYAKAAAELKNEPQKILLADWVEEPSAPGAR